MPTKDLILALDQGTTGSTVVIMDRTLRVIAESNTDFEQHFPKPGWVEHDLDQIWGSVLSSLKVSLGKAAQALQLTEAEVSTQIAAIGITNQRETIGFWDRSTTRALARAIVWQDRRTSDECAAMRARGMESEFQKRTGLLLDPYFSATKVAWALRNWGDVASAARAGTLAVGTMDSFLMARLSGGVAHVTDPSNASRTLCFDLHKFRFEADLWAEISQRAGFSASIWPEVRPSSGEFARTHGVPGLPDGIPIMGVLGDQQSALLGQACLHEGLAKCTYGTGAFLLMNTGTEPVASTHRLLTTVAWKFGSAPPVFALEGSAFIAGAAVQWLRDGLGIIKDSSEIEALATSVTSSEGVSFVPALTGLGAPYWDAEARGILSGLTRGTTKAHIARAVLEGIALQNADILEAMKADLGRPLQGLNVDGGAAANQFLMQFQADVLGVELRRPKNLETTALGAVFAAGLGAGIWKTPAEVEQSWQEDRKFTPAMDAHERKRTLGRWHRAIRQTQAK